MVENCRLVGERVQDYLAGAQSFLLQLGSISKICFRMASGRRFDHCSFYHSLQISTAYLRAEILI
jgi:hypothetical protein